MNELRNGAVLQGGKYRIERVLGQGGFGITYLATQTMLGCKVAIKEFFFSDCCERSSDRSRVSVITDSKKELVDKFRTKFLKEARLLLTINHSNIVRVMDAFEENDTAYYAMEFIDGISLSQLIESRGMIAPDESMRIMDTIGAALVYLHSRNINHLDIKPANIMVENGTGRIMLIDFGVSKQYDPETGQSTTTTPVGVSHGYAPLEQYNNGGVSTFSPQSDIYALGATLLKMLTGTTPPNAVELSQQGGPSIPTDVPRNFAAAIRAAMQPVKTNRPQSVQQFLHIMHNGGNDNEATVIGNGAANQTSNNGQSDKKGKNKSTNWFLIACIVAIIGGMVFFMANNHNKTNSAASIASADSDTIVADTVAVEEDTNVGTTLYTKSVKATESENVILTIEYPTEGSDILLQNIREWINESLGGKYNGDLADGQALFNHYWNEFMKDKVGEDGYGVYNHATIKKVYEDSKVVTFTNETYTYGDGAAHGMESTKGVTFRKSDGRKFTADLLDGSYKYQTEIKNGLRKYFEINTNDELMERLMLRDNTSGEVPFPSTDPWITADGVVFCYPPYEIACYADGMPTFTISTNVVKEKSAATTQTFFE